MRDDIISPAPEPTALDVLADRPPSWQRLVDGTRSAWLDPLHCSTATALVCLLDLCISLVGMRMSAHGLILSVKTTAADQGCTFPTEPVLQIERLDWRRVDLGVRVTRAAGHGRCEVFEVFEVTGRQSW